MKKVGTITNYKQKCLMETFTELHCMAASSYIPCGHARFYYSGSVSNKAQNYNTK
jgi:hypothetical protein